jgi:uncharacterized protein (DUF1501 family)
MIRRRTALLGLTAAVTLGRTSLAVAAAPTEKRFVVVVLRGGLDGLSAVVPYGDPDLAALRGTLLAPPPGAEGGLLDLGGFWGLHPALGGLHGLYQEGALLPVQAVAGFWRSRSHFEAQDLLEFGTGHAMSSGWLNRVAGLLPRPAASEVALAIATTPSPLLRGATPVGSWMPGRFATPPPDLYARLVALHEADALTGPAIAAGLRERGFAAAALAGMPPPPNRLSFPALAGAAGRLLAAADGPRLAAMDIGGWDTHSGQVAALGGPLRQLDLGLMALRTALGAAWQDSVVLVVTEFGRTVRINGTGGTDHGTGTVALVLGGNVAGGRVLADWPGLGARSLFEGRDLAPTVELRTLVAGLLAGHVGLDAAGLATVFPDQPPVVPHSGLVRA